MTTNGSNKRAVSTSCVIDPEIIRHSQPLTASLQNHRRFKLWIRNVTNNSQAQRNVKARTSAISIDIQIVEQLFDLMPDVAFFVKDVEGRYLTVNASFLTRNGLKNKDQVIGKRPTDISLGDFGNRPTQQDVKVLETGIPLLNHLQLQWRSPKEPGWCMTTKLPIRDAMQKIVGLIGFSRDVEAPIKVAEIPVEIVAAFAHLESNLNDPVSPSTLAAASNMSLPRFSRLMKRLYGVTAIQRIAQIRCERATHLLQNSLKSVSEIAQMCGFYDHSAFARSFRKTTGMTPTRCRNLLAEED